MLAYTHKARLFGLWLVKTTDHYGYLIGTRGQTATPGLIQRAWNTFPTYRTSISAYANRWLTGNPDKGIVNPKTGKVEENDEQWKVADCEGVEECFRMDGDIGNPLSEAELVNRDINSGYAFQLAKDNNLKHGNISTLPLDCPYPVAIGYPGHVMYYYQGKVYQAVGHRRGRIVEDYSNYTHKSETQYWYQMPYYDYEDYLPFKQEGEMEMITLKFGETSTAVNELQKKLMQAYGKLTGDDDTVYKPGQETNYYGTATKNGVLALLKEYGLSGDGKTFDELASAALTFKLMGIPLAQDDGVTQEMLDAEKAKVVMLSDQVVGLDAQLEQAGKDYIKLQGEKNELAGKIAELKAIRAREAVILS